MQAETLTLAGRYYDGTAAIFRGLVDLPGFDLRVQEESNVPHMFRGLFEGRYDASEMSLAELVYYTSRDRNDFIAIPVFPSRVFRHSFLFCSASSPLKGPEDLSGRRVGFQRWVQTACVWMRGMLIEDYGVSPAKTEWYVSSLHHWPDETGTVTPKDGSTVRWFSGTDDPKEEEDTHHALSAGKVNVVGVTEGQVVELKRDSRVRRLFADYAGAEADYYRRTHIFPIMHAIAIRKEAVQRRPDLPAALFRLFSDAKRLAREAVHTTPSMTLAWKDRYLAQESEVFGADAWAYGLAANQHTLDKFLDYCYQQGIAARRLAARELFSADTWDLSEG